VIDTLLFSSFGFVVCYIGLYSYVYFLKVSPYLHEPVPPLPSQQFDQGRRFIATMDGAGFRAWYVTALRYQRSATLGVLLFFVSAVLFTSWS
jgi:hypothetical protein